MLRGHTGPVREARYSPDGSRLASAGDDGTIRVWDARGVSELLALGGHGGHVLNVCFSPDGSRLAGVGADRTVRVWDARTGSELLTLRGPTQDVSGVCFSPDGARLAGAGRDRTVRVWDAHTGAELLLFRAPVGPVMGVRYSPDGTQLASTGTFDKTVHVWNARTGSALLTLRRQAAVVHGVCYSPDGSRLATAFADGMVGVWDVQTGSELLTLRGHSPSAYSVCYSPDGSRLSSAGGDGARVWDARTGTELLALRRHNGAVRSVCFSPDGSRLVSTGQDGVRVWDARLPQAGGYNPWAEDEDRRRVMAPSWQEADAAAAEKVGTWYAADWHLSRLIAVDSPSARLFARRRYVRMQMGHDRQAAADFDRALELDDRDFQALWWRALLRLSAGDREGYHKACTTLLQSHAVTTDLSIAAEVAAACVWGPDAAPDLTPAVRLAEKAVAANPKAYGPLHALGGVLLRAGRPEEAVKRLKQALAARGGDSTAADELLLALAYQRLGEINEARRWRDRAIAWMGRSPDAEPLAPNGKPPDPQARLRPASIRLEVPLLRHEVDSLLKATNP